MHLLPQIYQFYSELRWCAGWTGRRRSRYEVHAKHTKTRPMSGNMVFLPGKEWLINDITPLESWELGFASSSNVAPTSPAVNTTPAGRVDLTAGAQVL